MSTHVFPLGGGIDPECVICRKSRSQIEIEDADEALIRERQARRQDVIAESVEMIVGVLKTQLKGAGLVLADLERLAAGHDYALQGDGLDHALEAMARNVLQLMELHADLDLDR